MSSAINLDNYFERIEYEGPATVTLNTLKALHEKHTEAIPFENLNPLLGMGVKLDTASLEQRSAVREAGIVLNKIYYFVRYFGPWVFRQKD